MKQSHTAALFFRLRVLTWVKKKEKRLSKTALNAHSMVVNPGAAEVPCKGWGKP